MDGPSHRKLATSTDEVGPRVGDAAPDFLLRRTIGDSVTQRALDETKAGRREQDVAGDAMQTLFYLGGEMALIPASYPGWNTKRSCCFDDVAHHYHAGSLPVKGFRLHTWGGQLRRPLKR